MTVPAVPQTFYVRKGKRIFDVVGGCVLLVVTAPVQGVIAWQVRKKLGSPVLFRQRRPGQDARTFMMAKFRTMSNATDADGNLLPDDQRLLPLGQRLRELSLDELPELLNVVKGDMSLVGPRPLLMQYLPRYTPRQAQRHAVKPGITGLAQVSGRNAISWEDKFELDVLYVETVSFPLDVKILLKTVANVFARKDISADGHATMPEFYGSAAAQQRAPELDPPESVSAPQP